MAVLRHVDTPYFTTTKEMTHEYTTASKLVEKLSEIGHQICLIKHSSICTVIFSQQQFSGFFKTKKVFQISNKSTPGGNIFS